MNIQALANHLNATLHNLTQDEAAQIHINKVAPLDKAQTGDITFLNDKKYLSKLPECNASVVILTEALARDYTGAALVMKDPYVGFALAAQQLDPTPRPQYGIHPSAVIADTVQVGANANIGPNVVIEAGAIIGEYVTIGPGCVIGVNAVIGSGSHIHANVTIYHSCQLGQKVAVLSGTVIGPDGFGYANDAGSWRKIPQTGGVIIGDNTEIGALCTIDRGSLSDTVIEHNVIIDDQVHIAHNCQIGSGSCLCGAVAMAGSVKIGKNVIVAGTVAINGHITICDNVQITGNTMVTSDITEPGVYSSGMPHAPYNEWRRNSVRYKQLEQLAKRVKALETK